MIKIISFLFKALVFLLIGIPTTALILLLWLLLVDDGIFTLACDLVNKLVDEL